MAAAGRDERQSMRQRGAGSRNIANADFGLKMGSQGTREERQLMRQRGAGNRKVDNIDFGFSFPTPNASRRSVSKTPQTGRRNASRLSRTPLQANREPSTARSIRRNSTGAGQLASQQRSTVETPSVMYSGGQSGSKRRKLNTTIAEPLDAQSTIPRKSSIARFEIVEEDQPSDTRASGEPVVLENSAAVAQGPARNAPKYDNKENDQVISKENSTGLKRKKRKSVVQQVGKKKKRYSNEPARESVIALVEEDNTETEGPSVSEVDPTTGDDGLDNVGDDENPEVEERSPTTGTPLKEVIFQSKKRPKKRKSVVLTRGKRRSSSKVQESNNLGVPTPESTQERQSVEVDEYQTQITDGQGQHSPEESDFVPQVAQWQPGQIMMKRKLAAQKRRARMSVSTSPAPRDDPEQEGDETYVEEDHTPEPPTPAPRNKQRRKRDSTSIDASGRQARQRLRGSTFPILTHRMANIDALPTIMEDNENKQDSDEEQDPLSTTFVDRSVPNAIDVLAQICRETIETTIEKYSQSDGTSRAELKRKRTTLEEFSQSLDQRLFSMSEAVEHRLNLESRLRKSKREKADLQAQWMDLRQQRDDLALKMDDVRRRNWEAEKQSRIQGEISELAYKTELEIHREEPQEVGLEFLLRSVAGMVSCAGNGGGVLERVRRFNARLESLALGLEGR